MLSRILAVLLLCAGLFCLGQQSRSQTMLLLGAGKGAPGGAAYQGPGDVVSGAQAFYSCRAYSLAKAGTKAYRLIRASDSAQQDINSLASGLCDTASPATFCNSTTCKFVTYYDQTGALGCAGATACDATQGTDANRPAWTASAKNGWPCATGAGGQGLASAANFLPGTGSQPFTITGISERTGSFATSQDVTANGGAQSIELLYRTANLIAINGGTAAITAPASDSAFHSFVSVLNTTSSLVVVDGVAGSSGDAGSATWGANGIAVMGTGSRPLTGVFCESAVYQIAASSGQQTAIDANMRSASSGWNF